VVAQLLEETWVDVDDANPGFGLGVSDVEASFAEVDVLVVELAELGDPRSGEAERGDDRAADAIDGLGRGRVTA
jgi:hypothetical protein